MQKFLNVEASTTVVVSKHCSIETLMGWLKSLLVLEHAADSQKKTAQ